MLFNGVLSYIIASKNISEWDSVLTSFNIGDARKEGNFIPLSLIQSGQLVFNIENRPFLAHNMRDQVDHMLKL